MRFMHEFQTILGRGLVAELKNFVHRPFLIVTMEDLWPKFVRDFEGSEYQVYFVRSVEDRTLAEHSASIPKVEAVIGLGGGMAIDTAKYFAWKRRVPLFQVLTALSMDAAWSHRAGIRFDSDVRYIGWAVPEAIYIDYDVIRGAPRQLNHSGIGDILCCHTGVLDWRYASARGRCEVKWPYDGQVAAMSLAKAANVLGHIDDIRDLTDIGVDVLIDGLRWGGGSFHGNGWNPRHSEGCEHFFFYALEAATGRKFLHGQPVGLGVYIGSLLHDSRADEMLHAMHRIGLDIRPEAMGVDWETVTVVAINLCEFVKRQGLWYSILHEVPVDPSFVARVRSGIEAVYGPWRAPSSTKDAT